MKYDRRHRSWELNVRIAGDNGGVVRRTRRITSACHFLDDKNRFIGMRIDADCGCLIDFKSSGGRRMG